MIKGARKIVLVTILSDPKFFAKREIFWIDSDFAQCCVIYFQSIGNPFILNCMKLQNLHRKSTLLPRKVKFMDNFSWEPHSFLFPTPKNKPLLVKNLMHVCYILFQHLVAAHPKCWSKYAFSIFLQKNLKREEKARKLRQNLSKKLCFEFAPKYWLRVFFPEKNIFTPQPGFGCKLE